ncbi:hypothetical protein Tco_0298919 [Tanacetum coccineum]
MCRSAGQQTYTMPDLGCCRFGGVTLDTYDSNCDDISNAQAVFMANISNYGPDVISVVPHFETYLNDMENQGVQAMQDLKQTPVVDFTNNKIHSDSNIIPYSQYLQETQQVNVQDTHLQAQQDSMISSVIEQMLEQMINHVNNWEKTNKEQTNESVTAELERYKERIKTLEQRLNIDLSSRENMIDSQMDDMIKEKLALKEKVDSLEQNLSKQIKEKECLLQTFTVFKSKSKEKEDKYMENKIDLEKKIKELDNIIFKFSDKHVAMPVIDDEETLILEEKSRSKMSKKAKDPEVINKNISHKPIDYEKLNRLSEDFGKRFTPQQEMDAKQAFWFRISNPTIESSNPPAVKIEAPKELPKVSLVNESLKKLKFHLARFDNVVKIRTTPDARTEEYDRLLQQIMSQDVLLTVMNSMSLRGESVNTNGKRKEYCNLEAELLKSQNAFNDLLKRYSQLERHSQLQDKDTIICKLKDILKSMREKSKEENVNYDYCEIETKNVELENSVAKLLSENERLCNEINHVKRVFKEQFDSIKRTRVHTKEHSDSLIDKLNLKSTENEDLKAQLQDKVFVITKAHIEYLKYAQEQADILQGIVKQAKAKQPLDKELDFAYEIPPPPPSSQTPTQQTPHTISTIKLPILKKGEYDIWAMKMEHYLAHTDYPIWEVIQNGNGPISITTDTQCQIKVMSPRTAEEILARERERKARTTLLMALPENHLAKFHKMADAKEMWEAIKSRFGGNDESQRMMLKVYSISTSLKVSLITQKDYIKAYEVFENDVKGSTASSSSTQNVAFFSENTSSTNDVSTAYGVSNPSSHNSQYEQTSSYSLLANQSSCPQLDHEDLEQLDEFDLEEIDLKWQVAMISMRMKKFYKKTGRKLQFDAKELEGRRSVWQEDSKDMVPIDGEGVDWTSHSEEEEDYALMACNSSGSDTEVTSCSNECKESYAKLKKWSWIWYRREPVSDASIEIKAYTQGLKKREANFDCSSTRSTFV